MGLHRKTWIGALVVFYVAFQACSCLAQDPSRAHDQAREISSSVMSPFCPGKLLADCSSNQASQLREKIRSDIAAGKTKQQVLDELFALYGESLQSAPNTYGFGLTAWITPALFLLLGGIGFLLWSRHFRPEENAESSLSAEDEKKLQNDLRRS